MKFNEKHTMKFLQFFLAIGAFIIFVIAVFYGYFAITDISIAPDESDLAASPTTPAGAKPVVYFGVISRFSPNLIYEGYQPIMNYLTQSTPYRFELKLSNSYEETIHQLVSGQVQAAFLGTYIYLAAREKSPLKCILKPLNNQFEPFFRSVLVTRSDSPLQSIKDIKGKRLALPSPQSFSGNWLFRHEFKKYGLTISDLDSIHYFDYHHTVIYQVLQGNFDVGVVKDRVAYEFIDKGIRFLATSEPIPGSPIVVNAELDAVIAQAIQSAFLKIDIRKTEYQRIVKDWDPEFAFGFAIARDADYDHIEPIIASMPERP
ncbi:MAG: phosphate/phosphite/phosphonate ABC transporter substrate-binding protein [Candidatus Zhuqueibacterota bacterium]